MFNIPGSHGNSLICGGVGGHPACPVSDTYADGVPTESLSSACRCAVKATVRDYIPTQWEPDTTCRTSKEVSPA